MLEIGIWNFLNYLPVGVGTGVLVAGVVVKKLLVATLTLLVGKRPIRLVGLPPFKALTRGSIFSTSS